MELLKVDLPSHLNKLKMDKVYKATVFKTLDITQRRREIFDIWETIKRRHS
jgi:hypothetical protein